MRISTLFLICGSLVLSNAVLAQDATDGGEPTDVTLSDLTPEASAFDQLSPGNQKIAESLFGEQSIPDGATSEAWSLDQIAIARQDGQGWGKVFKQMKADGLVDAKNLGQLVSAHSKASKSVPTEGSRFEIVVTTGSGSTMSFARSRHSNRGKGSLNSGSSRSGHGSGSKFSGFNSGGGSGDSFSNSGHGSRGSISRSGSSSGNSGSGHGKK